jgi:hypothetical protein
MPRPVGRQQRLSRLQAALERRASPRTEMALIVALTGAGGFLSSAVLLEIGVARMWLRYLLALFAAYVVFLGCLRLWMHFHGRRSDAVEALDDVDFEELLRDPMESPADPSGGGSDFGGGGASASFGEEGLDSTAGAAAPLRATAAAHSPDSGDALPDLGGFDADELALPLTALAALAAALFASAFVVYGAPALLAELLLDGLVAGGLYRRLRRQPTEAWYAIALRKTVLPFAATCVLFVLAGWFVQSRLPEALTLSDALRLGSAVE